MYVCTPCIIMWYVCTYMCTYIIIILTLMSFLRFSEADMRMLRSSLAQAWTSSSVALETMGAELGLVGRAQGTKLITGGHGALAIFRAFL